MLQVHATPLDSAIADPGPLPLACAGHNAKTHHRFMELFPEIKVCHCKSWIRNQVQHICVWCNPPNLERFRKKVERLQSTKKDSSSPRLQAARPTRVQ